MASARIAVAQLNPGPDKEANLAQAESAVRAAAAAGADLVALPEYFSCYGEVVGPDSMSRVYRAAAEPVPGPTSEWLGALASELGIDLLGGSIFERDGERTYNTSLLVERGGELLASYRKTHLFEAHAPDLEYEEISAITPGAELVSAELELGGEKVTVGLSVCYDIRFPEVYRALAAEHGATLLFIPAAFPRETGRDHWELLLRARAVENQAFVIAPAQWGPQTGGGYLFGRSMIVDPRGTVLATVPDGVGFATAEADLTAVDTYRRTHPNLRNRRPEIYS